MTRSAAWTGLSAACLSLPLLLGACATEQQQVATKEDRLSAAGFVSRPADTPRRQAMLQRLPAGHFVKRDVNGRYVYFYGDPLVCGCVYVGSEQAYGTYRQQMLQRHLANQQDMTAQLDSNPSSGTGFGPDFF